VRIECQSRVVVLYCSVEVSLFVSFVAAIVIGGRETRRLRLTRCCNGPRNGYEEGHAAAALNTNLRSSVISHSLILPPQKRSRLNEMIN
jgi:hypothetical protein